MGVVIFNMDYSKDLELSFGEKRDIFPIFSYYITSWVKLGTKIGQRK